MSQRPRRPSARRPRGHLNGDGAGGPDRCAVGGAGALLPRGRKPGRPPTWTKRQLIDGIRWRVGEARRGGTCRRPTGRGRRSMACSAAGSGTGPGGKILTALQGRADAAGLITWDVSVDSTVARAHQHAAGARKNGDLQAEPPGGIDAAPADHGLGRSRGGLTTKVHLACEQHQKPLSIVITAGQRQRQPQFQVVLGRIRVPRPGPGRARTRPTGCWPTRPTAPAPTALTCAAAGSGAPSQKSQPGPPPQGQRPAAGRARLRPGTLQGPPRRGMRHRPATSATGPWPPAMTS